MKSRFLDGLFLGRLFLFGALAVAAPAQQELANRVRSAPPPRNAGVLHVASGTWTRKASSASIGADVIYNNTCPIGGYYSPLSSDTYITQGRVPSPTGPTNSNARPGRATIYLVDGFELAYCTDQLQANVGTYSVAFYASYVACTSVVGLPPATAFDLNGLPGTPVAGSVACWTVTFDLGSSSPPAFTLFADGDWTLRRNKSAELVRLVDEQHARSRPRVRSDGADHRG